METISLSKFSKFNSRFSDHLRENTRSFITSTHADISYITNLSFFIHQRQILHLLHLSQSWAHSSHASILLRDQANGKICRENNKLCSEWRRKWHYV
jgi:hypothetical protein